MTDLEENLVISSEMLKNLDIFFVDTELKSCWSNLVNFVEEDLVLAASYSFISVDKEVRNFVEETWLTLSS